LGVALLAGAIAFLYATWVLILARGYQPSADSHYHFTVARAMWSEGLAPSPAKGLPWTLLADLPVDHYWGFHLLLMPFALCPSYELGLRLATATLFALVFASFAAFLSRRRVPHPVAWSLLGALFSNQDWRYLQLRGGQLLLPLAWWLIDTVAFTAPSRRRNLRLLLIAWFAMLGYHGAILLWPIAVTASFAAQLPRFAARSWGEATLAVLRDSSLTALGLTLGLTLNPYADAHGSTFRFFVFHVWNMGRDTAGLYADQLVAEFRGMPPELLVWLPEWGLLFLATLGGLLWLLARTLLSRFAPRATRRHEMPSREALVMGLLSLLGILLVGQALRTREYAVPFALSFLAVLWSSGRVEPRWFRPLPLLLACAALAAKAPATAQLVRSHLPTAMYRGARTVLEGNGPRPILNLAEADFGMLRIEYPDVVCAHALSRYFLYPNRKVFEDLWYLHREGGSSDEKTEQILRDFYDRGVRLVATHGNRPLDRWAETHPGWLSPVFLSPVSAARLYRLTPANR